ncbi:ABC-F family ATP-binding cassette domain-containing protein [Parabacteroides sp. PF5-9]|uniref:ABC-F family ATP-binding cassette domain-containing protein n=1 Tax=Parabacteroides sp. PF5-9 TaxID=1742404 RepID=UPI002474BDB0|nr:ABC-F family ATP-binding cassette domain-containing protein [Parabacteroides sp. PF5-9]MDH6358385.1 ATPase subunit of ABC transporter with duplicated ATPase domains [Parabacteroides sp. PF5-9]
MSIIIQKITYIHPDNEVLFQQISLTVNKGQKIALVGHNGSGKSTLFQLIRGTVTPTEGEIYCSETPYYIPQHFGQYDQYTVAQALGIAEKLHAFHAIIEGDASVENFNRLNEDWSIEERSLSALAFWGLEHIDLRQPMHTLSGGEKTKIFLAGLQIDEPTFVLMDEPTNHLDLKSREKLYRLIESSNTTFLIISHDITLLNLLPLTYELTPSAIHVYGGNYSFYKEQKEQQLDALQRSIEAKEKELRNARRQAREVMERKQKHEMRGKKLNEKKGIGKMAMNTIQDQAEKSGTKLKEIHENKTTQLTEDLSQLRSSLPDLSFMKMNLQSSNLHTGKILVQAEQINFGYQDQPLWGKPLDLQIKSGDRLVIRGDNGTGKTTLIKLITGQLSPTEGRIEKADFLYLYLDQDYSLIDNRLTVYEQAQQFNSRHFPEYEVKMLLNRYLFPHDAWDKKCSQLSGGEKMRLVFCCLMINNQTPDLFILDEPTNNLDIQSVEIITSVIRTYEGTLLVVSHDRYFLNEINIEKEIELSKDGYAEIRTLIF